MKNIKAMISTNTYRSGFINLCHCAFSGPSFFLGHKGKGHGAAHRIESDPNYQKYASKYHTIDELLQAQIDFDKKYNVNILHIEPIKLRALLDKRFHNIMKAKNWINKIPNKD